MLVRGFAAFLLVAFGQAGPVKCVVASSAHPLSLRHLLSAQPNHFSPFFSCSPRGALAIAYSRKAPSPNDQKVNIPRRVHDGPPSYAPPPSVGTPTYWYPSFPTSYTLTVPGTSTPLSPPTPTSIDSSVSGGSGFPSSTWSITPPIILPHPGTTPGLASTCLGAEWSCTTPAIVGMCWSSKVWIPCDSTSTYHSTRTVTISSTITNHFPLFSPTSSWSIDSSVSGGVGTPKYTNSYPPPTSSSTPWTVSSSVSAESSCPAVSLATLTVTPYSCVATPTSTVYFSVTSTIVEEITATRVIGTPPPPGTVTLTTTRYYGTPAPPSIITVTKVNTSILTTPPTTVTRESTVFDTTTLTVRFPYTVHTTTTSTTAALWPTPPLCTPCGASSRDATTVLTETVYTSTTATLPTPSPPSSSTPGSTVSSVEGVTSTPTLNPTSEVGPPFGTWSTTRPSHGPPTYAASPEPVFSVVRGEEGWERKVVE
ncbi:uncharacterized protein IWZ02DRAFT_518026 [Phyllosticta citriasiana]|uniref:uncharacterized protein n=1 Tax=Phyllosticta citriasiana TaxID=595635 RepID=UPI0030FDB9E8